MGTKKNTMKVSSNLIDRLGYLSGAGLCLNEIWNDGWLWQKWQIKW